MWRFFLTRRFWLPFHQFLMALSLRPLEPSRDLGPSLTYLVDHHLDLLALLGRDGGHGLSDGLRLWWYLSRHCLGDRDPRRIDIRTQLSPS